jgi:hypothetical protein
MGEKGSEVLIVLHFEKSYFRKNLSTVLGST